MTPQERAAIAKDLLPVTLRGWSIGQTILLPENKDLYAYINGGAELYISYGFGGAMSCTYTKENHSEVLAEVYDLLEARNAFGVFSQTRETENLKLGQGAFHIPGAVFFWKDRYYVSLSTQEATKEAEDFIMTLAESIESKIPATGILPGLLKFLPEEGLIPYGYLYFHHYIWLNSYYYIADDNVLQVDEGTDAVLAKYAAADSRQYLLLVQYRSKEKAHAAFDTFGRSFFPDGLTEHCIRRDDHTWLAAFLSDNLIVAVFNGADKQNTLQLLHTALTKCSIKQQ